MSANASLHQLGSETPVVDYLQGGEHDTQLTFFKGESDPYAQFATNWIRLNFQQQNMQDGAVETSTYAEMQRAGDMLCHAFLVITAPPIANVSSGLVDGDFVVGTDPTDIKRAVIHASDGDQANVSIGSGFLGALNNATDTPSVFLDAYSNATVPAGRARTAGPGNGVIAEGDNASQIVSNIPALDNNQLFAHYGNYAPATLVKELEVVIGTNPISKVTGLVMQANCELWTASDRLPRRAVNKSADPAEKGCWALSASTWCLPVPFWFNQGGYHSSLALCALSFHSIRFNLVLHPYTRSIVNGCSGDFTDLTLTMAGSITLETKTGATSAQGGVSVVEIVDPSSAITAPITELKGSQFKFYMLLELIYLSDDERDTYTDMTDEILITQFQYASAQTLTGSKKSVEMPLRFNHPVSQVVVAGQLQSNINLHRYGEYEGPTNPLSVSRTHPEGLKTHWLKNMKVTFNNNDRTAEQPAWFFNETVPSVNAERVPDNHFYLYSFGLSSPNGSGQFAGGADFSRLDNAFAVITANDHVFADMSLLGGLDGAETSTTSDKYAVTGGQKVTVNAFGVSANVAKFENGLLGVCFL